MSLIEATISALYFNQWLEKPELAPADAAQTQRSRDTSVTGRLPGGAHGTSRHTANPISCKSSPSQAPGRVTAARTGGRSSTVSTCGRSTGATNLVRQL